MKAQDISELVAPPPEMAATPEPVGTDGNLPGPDFLPGDPRPGPDPGDGPGDGPGGRDPVSLVVLDVSRLPGQEGGEPQGECGSEAVLSRLRRLLPESGPILLAVHDGRTLKVKELPVGLQSAGPRLAASLNSFLQLQLTEEEARYRAMVEALDGLIYVSSGDYELEFVNRRFLDRLGAAVLGQKCYRALHQQETVCPWCLSDSASQGEAVPRETFSHRDNRWYIMSSTPIQYAGKRSRMTVVQDITERKLAEERTLRLAYHDQLTGLPNRSLLNDRLAMALAHAQRSRKKVAVMMLDLDRFKDINDNLGHRVGDAVLQGVARRLAGLLRKSDTVARVGGDEFILISTEIDQLTGAVTIARKVLEAFRTPFACHGLEVPVAASLGIALFPDHGQDLENLVQHADLAMYRAKKKGRRSYRIYSPSQDGKERTLARLAAPPPPGFLPGQEY